MIKVGDYVSRNSYHNDVIFRVVGIQGEVFLLKGTCIRLMADSPISDLKKEEVNDDEFCPSFDVFDTLDRNDFFYLPGKVLHIDGDREYLDKCLNYYRKNKIKAYGVFCEENMFSEKVTEYLNLYNPDILVLTGHDAYYRKRANAGYKNTSNFVEAVREARLFEKSHDKLLIIAGACQSDYEELIKAGANFASSPKRINIHALDPAIIACSLAFSDKNQNIDLISILEKTKYGSSGMGGIITKGTMYTGYPRN